MISGIYGNLNKAFTNKNFYLMKLGVEAINFANV
jgi:hypothetical protein